MEIIIAKNRDYVTPTLPAWGKNSYSIWIQIVLCGTKDLHRRSPSCKTFIFIKYFKTLASVVRRTYSWYESLLNQLVSYSRSSPVR